MNPLVFIYADESCLGNGRKGANPGGAAGLVEFWRDDHWVRMDYWLGDADTTNNRMAIRSAIAGISAMKQRCRIVFTSDSQYLVKGMREWIHGWVKRGFMRPVGPVENAELWRELLKAARAHDIDWRWVRGHAGHPQNEYANDLAIAAARKLDASPGLVPSGYADWLEKQREKGRYMDYMEFAPIALSDFKPVRYAATP